MKLNVIFLATCCCTISAAASSSLGKQKKNNKNNATTSVVSPIRKSEQQEASYQDQPDNTEGRPCTPIQQLDACASAEPQQLMIPDQNHSGTQKNIGDDDSDEWVDISLEVNGKKEKNPIFLSKSNNPTTLWFAMFKDWYKENIEESFLLEQYATQFKVITAYSMLTRIIEQNYFKRFITYLDTQEGAGSCFLDKSLRQAITQQNIKSVEIIVDAIINAKFLHKLSDERKQQITLALQDKAFDQQVFLARQIEEYLVTTQDRALRLAKLQDTPKTPIDVQSLGKYSEQTVLELTQFASQNLLPLPEEK